MNTVTKSFSLEEGQDFFFFLILSIIATDTPETEIIGFEISSYQVSFSIYHALSEFPWLLENYIGISFL